MKKQPTKVISFRLPAEIAEKLDKQAKKEKKRRSELVEAVFTDAFQQRVENVKQAA